MSVNEFPLIQNDNRLQWEMKNKMNPPYKESEIITLLCCSVAHGGNYLWSELVVKE